MDWLDEEINNNRNVFVPYTSYTRGYQKNIEQGIILFYQNGKLKGNMKFKESFDTERFGKNIHVHLRTINKIFENFWQYLDESPLIMLSSSQATEWLMRGTYKQFALKDTMKVKLYTHLNTFKPEFKHYDILGSPYHLLRELCLKENVEMKKRMLQGFVDFSDLNE